METQGHPFHGACPVARCCQEKGVVYCGQCAEGPCGLLEQYACDPDHGDDPKGARIVQCWSWRCGEIRNFADFCALILQWGFSLGGGDPKGIAAAVPFGWEGRGEDGSPIQWHTGCPDTDPWEWRMRVLEERQDIAYGKVFFRASGYITRQWYPYFLSVRRKGETLEQAYEAGRISRTGREAYQLLLEKGPLPVHQLKEYFSKEEGKKLEGALVELQMGMFITISGRAQKVSRQGQPYGWSSAVFSTVEDFWLKRGFEPPFINPEEAYEAIQRQVYRLNPCAQPRRVEGFIRG